jgi:Tfp pilus assembly PilM family ATPase
MSTLTEWLSLQSASAPSAAIDVAINRVSAAAIDVRGGRVVVTAHAVELLEGGALTPSLVDANVRDRVTVAAAVARVLDAIGRPRRVALIVPDQVAKVSLMRFEKVPAKTQDLDQLVRWQVKKAAPFPIEEAQVSYVPGGRSAEGQEFVVSLARRDTIKEYESMCEAAGAHAGLVDISTFSVINTVLSEPANRVGDSLLVNVTPDCASIAILRGSELIFFRSLSAEGDGNLSDLVHQTAMYYQDRLEGGEFGRVLLCGAAAVAGRRDSDVEQIRHSLEERLRTPVQTVDVRTAVTLSDRIMATQALLDTLAPVVGALLRGREVAA